MTKQFGAAVRLGLCGAMLAAAFVAAGASSQSPAASRLRAGARVFVNSMPEDFDSYLKSAFARKKVPLVVVDSREEADFEIKGTSETQQAGTAKKIIMLDWRPDEQASISVADLKSGEIVFAYSVNKKSAANGKATTAEACAKHLKDRLDKGK